MRLPRDIQLKLELFLRKSILIWKNMNLQDVLKCLDSKFLEILQSNKTPNKFWIDHLKITFKCLNFVCEAFKICSKIRTPPISEAFEFQNFFVYSKS